MYRDRIFNFVVVSRHAFLPIFKPCNLLRHLTLPIIPNGATSNNKFAAAAPTGSAPTELHPPPDGTSASGVAVTTMITGVCVGGTGVAVCSGVAVGAGVSVGTAVCVAVAVGTGVSVGVVVIVGVSVAVGVAVCVAVAVGVGVSVGIGVLVGVGVIVGVGVWVAVAVGVCVGVEVGVGVAVGAARSCCLPPSHHVAVPSPSKSIFSAG